MEGGGVYRLLSPKFKEVLEKFKLPPHRFYPAEVTHEITGEKRPYYLFHLLSYVKNSIYYIEDCYWPAMEANLYLKPKEDPVTYMEIGKKRFIEHYPQGSLTNFTDLVDTQYEGRKKHAGINIKGKVDYTTPEGAILQEKIELYESSEPYFVYTYDWDLMGMGSSIIITKKIMQAIKDTFTDREWFRKVNSKVIMGYQPGDDLTSLLKANNIPHGIPKE